MVDRGRRVHEDTNELHRFLGAFWRSSIKGLLTGTVHQWIPGFTLTAYYRLVKYILGYVQLQGLSRWWFHIFFISIPTWGNDPIWLICFRWGWNHQLDCFWHDYCTTVDGSEIGLTSLQFGSLWKMIYRQGYVHPRWCRISSINSSTWGFKGSTPLKTNIPPKKLMVGRWNFPFKMVPFHRTY